MPFDFSHLKVLFVDDSKIMRELGTAVLEILNVAEAAQAADGQEAYQKFCEGHYDLVMADYKMPRMNGVELAHKIRTSPDSPNQEVPIVIITGHLSDDFIGEARSAGVTEVLIKPFSANDLTKHLAYILQNPRPFVETENYFGPDRRRLLDGGYQGPERREGDKGAKKG